MTEREMNHVQGEDQVIALSITRSGSINVKHDLMSKIINSGKKFRQDIKQENNYKRQLRARLIIKRTC